MNPGLLRRLQGVLLTACLALAWSVGPVSAGALTPPQKSAVDREIHDYLMQHPEVVLDALKAAQQKSDAEAAAETSRMIAAHRQELLDDPNDLVRGNPKGDVTLVEFFDYRCPYCKALQPTLDALLASNPNLRIVYKEFPILGETSVFATRVALASRRQGKYAAFHRAMMAVKGNVSDDTVLQVAASVGIDLKKLKADMGAADIGRIINANYSLAEALGITGTPGLIIGDTLIPGAVDYDTLSRDIAAVQKKTG